MPPVTIDTLLFDLDGTIIDTEPSAAEAIRDCFGGWGIRVTAEDASFVTGRTWASAFDFLLSRYSVPVSREKVVDTVMAAYRDTLERDLHVVPGSVAAIQALAGSGRFRLGLVSGSGRSEILWALKKLGIADHFEVILGAEDYPRSKPAPDGYAKALSVLGSRSERGLVFEDSTAGIASARAAGLWVVAITATNHFAQDTSKAHGAIIDLTAVDANWIEKFSIQLA